MKVDILFPSWRRPEFQRAARRTLVAHTNWKLVERFVEYQEDPRGPVAIMKDYLSRPGADLFAKIDNDTIVPPRWLEAAIAVMEAHPELDLLGIEPPASRTPAPWGGLPDLPEERVAWDRPGYVSSEMIGGIGLMRRRAFERRREMQVHGPLGVGGFSDWQLRHPEIVKGWIIPPLRLFLLDRLPVEPWASLSSRYIAEGAQRPWTNYDRARHELWDWWTGSELAVAA
jgi:hypothetical protein